MSDYCTADSNDPARQFLESHRPRVLAALGARAHALCQDYRRHHSGVTVLEQVPDPAQPGQSPDCDLTVCTDVLEAMELPQGRGLLASLRDRGCRRLLIGINLDGTGRRQWTRNEMFAMGLVAARVEPDRDGRYWFYHDLGDYKSTPDWLNSRYWAHPERFGKDYW